MDRAARPTSPLALRVGAAAAVAALAAAALPAAASAASLTIGPTPANGANIKFTGAKTTTSIDYTADLAGCANPQVAPLILDDLRRLPPSGAVPAGPTGAVTQTWTRPPKRETRTWTLALLCDGQAPIGATETRTVNLLPSSPHAKLDGRFILTMLIGKKGKRRWSKPGPIVFLSSRKAGVFRSRDDQKAVWKYKKKTKKYRMRTRFRSSCQARGGRVANGSVEIFTFVTKVRRTDFTKGQRFVKKMTGTWSYVRRLNASGRAGGCSPARASGRAILVRKGKVVLR
jgi:hypothetical protein